MSNVVQTREYPSGPDASLGNTKSLVRLLDDLTSGAASGPAPHGV
jgi:hypothetical protein